MHTRLFTFLYKFEILALVVIPLAGTVTAVILLWNRYVFWQDISLLLAFYALSMLGITIGYHRMLTHQGFSAPWWLKGFFLICGCMAFEGRPLDWAPTHIKHHAHADDEDDPHSPLHGFWHAHVGWIFSRQNFAPAADYAPHLLHDPVVLFVDRFYVLWMAVSLLIPFLLGGWTGLLWGGAVRIFFNTHATYSVNSICHTFGRRHFETTDESRNEWIVGLLAFGEGWHNNHHAFPRSAFHGLRWWQFDLSGVIIRLLERLGIIADVQRASVEAQQAHQAKSATVQHHLHELRSQLSEKIQSAKAEVLRLVEQYGTPRTTQQELAAMTVSCENALERLQEIQQTMLQASHLKRQRLQVYMQEVQSLVVSVHASLSPVLQTETAARTS